MRYALPQPFRDLEHTADVGVEVEGASQDETLARLVLAQTALLTGGAAVDALAEDRVSVPAGARTAMAVEVLRELLFRFATRRALAAWCEVRSFDESAGAVVHLGVGRFDQARHGEGLDLKAVTWHQACFEEVAGGWRARIVFDI